MTGEDLYDLYREASWNHTLAEPPAWDELSKPEQEVWTELASKLVPWEE